MNLFEDPLRSSGKSFIDYDITLYIFNTIENFVKILVILTRTVLNVLSRVRKYKI